jgi:hypothetical protein
MRARRRNTPRVDALRLEVHKLLCSGLLTKIEVADYCNLALEQSGRWFFKVPKKGCPRADATLRLLQLICKKRAISLPIPSWALLRALGWQLTGKGRYSLQKIASATGTHRSPIYRYLKNGEDVPDGEWTLDFLAFLFNSELTLSYAVYFSEDCSDDYEKAELYKFEPALGLDPAERACRIAEAEALVSAAEEMTYDVEDGTWSLSPQLALILGPMPIRVPTKPLNRSIVSPDLQRN